jgi:hypothetical protein
MKHGIYVMTRFPYVWFGVAMMIVVESFTRAVER